jgi:hypothetical protein
MTPDTIAGECQNEVAEKGELSNNAARSSFESILAERERHVSSSSSADAHHSHFVYLEGSLTEPDGDSFVSSRINLVCAMTQTSRPVHPRNRFSNLDLASVTLNVLLL